MSSTLHRSAVNRLLAALPNADRRRVVASCDLVELDQADVLYAAWEPLDCIYFPTTSFISLTIPHGESSAFEVGLIGREGMLGLALALDGETSHERAVVQGAGSALRLNIAGLKNELKRSAALRGEIDRYVHVRLSQLAQSAICAHFHLLESRLARRLLMTQDRAGANTFTVTQEVLASKLGVRRVGVTKAASALQKRRLIHYSRGDITVLDRRGLLAASCRCYKIDQDAYDRIRRQ